MCRASAHDASLMLQHNSWNHLFKPGNVLLIAECQLLTESIRSPPKTRWPPNPWQANMTLTPPSSTTVAKLSGVFFFRGSESKDLKVDCKKDLHITPRRPALKIKVHVDKEFKKKEQNLPSCGCIPTLSELVSCSLKTSWRKKNTKEINRTYQDNTSILLFAWVRQIHPVCNHAWLIESMLKVWGILYTTGDGMLVMGIWQSVDSHIPLDPRSLTFCI